MMLRSSLALLLLLAACGRSGPAAGTGSVGSVVPAETASAAEVDSLWSEIRHEFSRGKWGDVVTNLERILLEFRPGDPRIAEAHFYLAEAYFAQENHLQAAREFRRVSDETPNHPLAPRALLRLGDAYADLWKRPELDPSYGQTALTTYQELVNRYPNTDAARRGQAAITELEEKFAVKQYKAAMFYFRLKAYDSAILYFKDLVATYPRTQIAPEALGKLVEAYETLGYREDVQETCGYIRRFHPTSRVATEACPSDTLVTAADSTGAS